MARELMTIDVFSNSITRSNTYLSEFNVDLFKILTREDASHIQNTINSFVSIAAIQVSFASNFLYIWEVAKVVKVVHYCFL